jgi:hypothetical protein
LRLLVYKACWTSVIDFLTDVYCMNKFTTSVCQYPKQLAWEHSYPVNKGADIPKSVKSDVGGSQLRRTKYAIMATTVILLLVVSVPIADPAAAQSDRSSFGERHTTLCGVGPGILGGTGHPFLSMGLKAICSSS